MDDATDYVMNPEKDVVLFGRHLQEGMIVLLENSAHRNATPSLSRWCMVTYVEKDIDIRFVGVYEDGFQAGRRHDLRFSWIVRQNSIPADPIDPMDFKLREILQRWGLTETQALDCLHQMYAAGLK